MIILCYINVGYTCFRLNEFLECADDLAIDVPKFWPYVAEGIGKHVKCTLLVCRYVAERARCSWEVNSAIGLK
jgi:hypothetical protein